MASSARLPDGIEERLQRQAAAWPELKLAVLFGSQARGEARSNSDVDLGLLLAPYSAELRFRVEAELGRAAGRPVDVVLLDDAPPLLRFEIARDGMLLFQREDHLWTDFKAKAMVDWWDWAPTHRMIAAGVVRRLRERIAEVKVDVVARKVARASARLNDAGAAEFLSDVKSRDLASFYLFLAIQECIDLAAHWVSDAGWNVPEDAGATWDLLAEHGAMEEELALALRGAVGLRNRIAHGYASVDHARVHEEYRGGSEALRRFLSLVSSEAGL
jgi:uncharacterized protein YutE (UPF0331/DUF86 family)/predicted nucleotidyltransferase